MLSVLLIACVLGANAAVVTPPADARRLGFVGFSQRDALSAWTVTLRRDIAADATDTYTLVKLLAVVDHRVVATFRQGSVVRRDAHGREVSGGSGAEHADWQAASSARAWEGFRRKHRFVAKRLEFGDSLVRVLPDPDTHLTAKAEKKTMQIEGVAGGPLGYTVVARLYEGDMYPLGHYRIEAQADAVPHGELVVYHSADGQAVAVLSRQRQAPHLPQKTVAAVVLTPDENPLGSTKVGFFGMIDNQARSVGNSFRRMWPKRAHDYDIYVGDDF